MKLDPEAVKSVQALPKDLRGLAVSFLPTPEREAAIARELAAEQQQQAKRRERELASAVLRGQDGAFGLEVKEALLHAMRQCDHKPSLDQLERMGKIIRDGKKKAAALTPARRGAR
jgi:glutaminase